MTEATKNLLTGLIALLALLPSVAVLAKFISLPPTQEEILRISIATISIVSALSVFLLAGLLRTVRVKVVVVLISFFALIGLVSLFAYQEASVEYYVSCTVDDEVRGIVLPLQPGPIQKGYGRSGICGLAQDDLRLADEIRSNNRTARLLLIALLGLAQFGLTVSILLGSVKLLKLQGSRPT